MKTFQLLFVLAAFGLIAGGCAKVHDDVASAHQTVLTGHPGGAYSSKNATKYNLEDKEVFVLMDRGVQKSITSSGIQHRRLDDNRLEIAANIRNREKRRIQVQVNCVFKDKTGFSTGDETPWQTLILTENAQETVRFVSMNEKAESYTVRVRQAR